MTKENEEIARLASALFQCWNLTDSQICGVLQIASLDVFQQFRESVLVDDFGLRERLLKLLHVHGYLKTLFPSDTDLAYSWVTTPNAEFGSSPLIYTIENAKFGVDEVLSYLKKACFA